MITLSREEGKHVTAFLQALRHPVIGTFILGLGTIVVAFGFWLCGYTKAAVIASLSGQLLLAAYAVACMMLDILRRRRQ